MECDARRNRRANGTGGRLKRVSRHLKGEKTFCMTYGDGVSDVNITELIALSRTHGKKATLTAVQPLARFGLLDTRGTEVQTFQEKPTGDGGWINGGFFVLSTNVLAAIPDDPAVMWEREPLEHWRVSIVSRRTTIMISGSQWIR